MAIKIQGSTIIDDSRKVLNASQVGIGITNPSVELDVDGNVNISGVATVTGGIDAIGIQSGGVDITTGIITALNFIGVKNTVALNGTVVDIGIDVRDPTTRTTTRFVATASQSSFAVSYDVGYVDVFLNGSKLDSTEYTATNGTSVNLTTAAAADDIVEIVAYESVNISEISSATQGFDVTGHLETDTFNSSGIVTAASGIDAIGIQSGGVNIADGVITALNFIGAGNTFALNGTVVDISIAGGGGGGGISSVADDTSPQLGGNLDLNSKDITGTGNLNITGIVTATSFVKSSNSGGFLRADGTEDTNTYLTTETQTLDDVVGLGSDTTQTITVGTATTGVIIRPDGTLNVSGVSTFTGNVSFGSTATFGDNDRLRFGDGNDLEIYHDGTNSFIENGTGKILIRATTNENSIRCNPNGSVELYYDNSKKFETTGAGVTVTGHLETDTLNVSGVSTFSDEVSFGSTATFGDDDKIILGDGNDLQIYHDGSHSWIRDEGAGHLYIRTNGDRVNINGGSDNLAKFNKDGSVELYYDNSKKFETTSYGIYVTGAGNTSTIGGAANLVLDPSTVGDNTGTVTILGNLQVDGTQTVINSTTMTVDDLNITLASGAANASAANGAGITVDGASATLTYASTGDKWVFNKAPYYNTNRLLTTADEGTGNGIDADTVDGIEASSFLRSDADDTTTGQIQLTKANSTATDGGQIYLNGATGNRIDFNQNGVAAPAFTTRSAGTKIVLYSSLTSAAVDYAFGIESGTLWYSVPTADVGKVHRWYGGTTQLADLKGSGELVIGSTSLTGTASQKLQVTGGAYVSGDVGIGETAPEKPLHVKTSVATPVIVERTITNNTAIQYRNSTSSMFAGMGGNALGWGVADVADVGSDAHILVTRTDGELLINSTSSTGTASQKLQVTGGAYVSGDVGIGTTLPGYKLHVNGSFAATTKSFIIEHPTKEGMKLRYGSLEGPENGVYIRGRLKGNNTIELPEHWTGLVDEETITVNLTPIGRKAPLHSVVDIADNTVIVESANDVVDCFYTVFGERKDVEKLEVEF